MQSILSLAACCVLLLLFGVHLAVDAQSTATCGNLLTQWPTSFQPSSSSSVSSGWEHGLRFSVQSMATVKGVMVYTQTQGQNAEMTLWNSIGDAMFTSTFVTGPTGWQQVFINEFLYVLMQPGETYTISITGITRIFSAPDSSELLHDPTLTPLGSFSGTSPGFPTNQMGSNDVFVAVGVRFCVWAEPVVFSSSSTGGGGGMGSTGTSSTGADESSTGVTVSSTGDGVVESSSSSSTGSGGDGGSGGDSSTSETVAVPFDSSSTAGESNDNSTQPADGTAGLPPLFSSTESSPPFFETLTGAVVLVGLVTLFCVGSIAACIKLGRSSRIRTAASSSPLGSLIKFTAVDNPIAHH